MPKTSREMWEAALQDAEQRAESAAREMRIMKAAARQIRRLIKEDVPWPGLADGEGATE